MSCKLCGKNLLDSAELLELYSVEGNEIKIVELIQKHIPFLQLDQNLRNSYVICRNCCQTLCDFHEFYVFVENAQKSYIISESDPLLHDDFKPKYDCVKHDPEYADCTNNARLQPMSEEEINHIEADLPIKNGTNTTKNAKNESYMLNYIQNDLVGKITKLSAQSSALPKVRKKITSKKQRLKSSKLYNKSTSTALAKREQIPAKEKDPNDFDEFLSKNFKLSCSLCNTSLLNFAEMKSHFRKEHHINGFVLCCGKKFRHRYRLVDHVHTHLNPNLFKCSECNKVLADRRGLQEHLQLHEKKLERIFHCKTCLKSYPRRSSLMRHIQEHVPEEEKKINCPQCKKTFATFYLMHQHLKIIHLNTYSKICDICGNSIRGSREVFQLHQQEHTGAPKPEIECQICGLKLSSKYGLNRHVKVVHLEEAKPQMCTICSKVYPTKAAYKSHMNYVHNLERKHQCSMCEKTFKKAQVLREHMATHTGEVLYTCPNCPKTFISNANMHSHRKKVHRKEWEESREKRQPRKHNMLTQNNRQHETSDSLIPVTNNELCEIQGQFNNI